MDHEAAGPGDAGDDLGEVRGAPRRRWPRSGGFEADGVVPATVAAGDELIDEAPPGGDVAEVARAAQDQRLVERGLEVAVVGFHRSVLVRFSRIARLASIP
ncbi:hypothetical protein FJM51_23370 [Amaricoccus solimangrovi]|uniref:Uncharacterized protein n=1 Tax=Amaricoccus solimangrovi TaxID=2589815 RepID=A0A501W9D9_9RHOB|nr:hypothetical protein FJM51_23370 [Amaricoccus solimangrovi]